MARSLARQAGLLAVTFVATFVLLAGAWAVIGQVQEIGTSPRPSVVAASPAPASPGTVEGSAVPSPSSSSCCPSGSEPQRSLPPTR